MTYDELLEKLKLVDELSLLELLELTSDDLVEQFSNKINENLDRVHRYLSE